MLFLFNEENSKETQYSKKNQTLSINFYFWVKKFKIKLPVSWSLITIIAIIFCVSTCWWDPSAIGKNHPLKLIKIIRLEFQVLTSGNTEDSRNQVVVKS